MSDLEATNDLRAKVADSLRHMGAQAPGQAEVLADAALFALGLTDLDAALERAQRAIVASVDEHVEFNIQAYGKPHTGEGEDTEFICTDAAKKALAAVFSGD